MEQTRLPRSAARNAALGAMFRDAAYADDDQSDSESSHSQTKLTEIFEMADVQDGGHDQLHS